MASGLLQDLQKRASHDSGLFLTLSLLSATGLFVSVKFLIGLGTFFYATLAPGYPLSKFGAKRGAWAVVTGATAGIGLEFARQLAKAGFNVLLVSRNGLKLAEVAKDIEAKCSGVQTRTFAIDLASAGDAEYTALAEQLAGVDVGILINNAGMGANYPEYFHLVPEQETLSMIAINAVAVAKITRMVVPGMIERKRGLILNIGSVSGYLSTPLLATYAATKAFLDTFSQSIGTELAGKGIVATALSKIRKPSLFAPSPKAYVRSTLAHLGNRSGGWSAKPYTSTPYFGHALLQAVVERFGNWKMLESVNFGYLNATRQKALKKKEAKEKAAKTQ